MYYSPEELEKYFGKDSEELEKENLIFQELYSRAKENNLSHTEAYYFCTIIKHTYNDYGIPDDYEVCKEYIFDNLFRTYYKDFNGYEVFTDKFGRKLTNEQKEKDLNQLEFYFKEWESVINYPINSVKDTLLLEVIKETREDIKKLKRKSIFNIYGFFYESNLYNSKYKSLMLRSRFIKNKAKEYIEKNGRITNIHFNNKVIEFNEHSLVHIYLRHSAKVIKQTDLDKSFHNRDIEFSNLGKEIKYILESIDKTLGCKEYRRNIKFNYKSKPYSICLSREEEKSIEGISGMKKYYQVETFYPIEKKEVLEKLKEMNIVSISNELEVYI